MSNEREYSALDETSPSIQTHLGIIQNVIQRMATNSTSSKTWCITIVSAILVIVADKGKPQFVWIAITPTLLFLFLDAYYLALEKGFRAAYNSFIGKLHSGTLTANALFAVAPEGNVFSLFLKSLFSFSVWPFYVTLLAMTYITKCLVI